MASGIGGLILDARLRAGLTQAELAERAGTAPSAISAYEHERKEPSLSTLRRLVAACGMELRMGAEVLSQADRAQYARDKAVGVTQGRANAARIRGQVRSVRELTEAERKALVANAAS